MKRIKLFSIVGAALGMVLSTGAALIATHHFENKSIEETKATATLDDMAMQFKYYSVTGSDPANCSFSVGGGNSSATSSYVTSTLAADGTYTEGTSNYPAYKYTLQESAAHQQFIYASVVIRLTITVQPWEHTRVRILFNPIQTIMTEGKNADHAIEFAADDTLHNVYNTATNFSDFVYNRDDYTTKSTGSDVLARAGRRAAGEAATALEHSWYITNSNNVSNQYWIYFAVSGYVESTGGNAHTLTQSVRFGVNIRETAQYACRFAYSGQEYFYDTVKDCINYINTLPTTSANYALTLLRDVSEPGGIVIKRNLYLNLAGYILTKSDSASSTTAFFRAREEDGLTSNISIEVHHTDVGRTSSCIKGPCGDAIFLLGNSGDQYTVTLKVYTNVQIYNTASSGRAIVVHQNGILQAYQGAEIKSDTTVAAIVCFGKAYISCNVTVPNGDTIYVSNSEHNKSGTTITPSVYMYFNPTLSHGSGKYTISVAGGGPNTVNLYANDGLDNSSQYLSTSASDISINYATKPTTSGVTIVRGVNSQQIANKFTVNGLSSSLLLSYNSTTKILSTANARTVTYNANGGTGTMTGHTVVQGSTISIKTNSFAAPQYYHFGYWATNYSGTGTHYSSGDSYTVNSNTTFYAIWEQTTLEKVEQFIGVYMHMDSNVDGQCNTYFPPAVEAFNALEDATREMFCTSNATAIKNARNRLNAWAVAKGYIVDGNNRYIEQSNRIILINKDNNFVPVVVVMSIIAATSVACFILMIIRKRKHY